MPISSQKSYSGAFSKPAIIPRPLRLEYGEGSFELLPATGITFDGEGAEDIAELLAEYLRPATGHPFRVLPNRARQPDGIHLSTDGEVQADAAGFQREDYQIVVDSDGVWLRSPSPSGLARAIQTFRQLLPERIFSAVKESGPWEIPHVAIEDAPRFRWRGLHLDVARQFFCVNDVCLFIDALALHRFNVFHLHLTDDQGWRIEIKKYPKLTDVGSVRKQTLLGHDIDRPRKYDGVPHGGFYRQEELREIIAFAERRKVTVVPEIDMPGHSQAAIAAYPELGCTDAALEVRCHWGISQHTYNVEESTLDFCRDVLDEVMAIFPSRFIHVGGDEAPKWEWSESERTQTLMAERNIKNEHALQSWFIHQMVKHVEDRGRRLVGWDEILEGGLPPGSTVMSWQGEEGGIQAANQGHDVVMAPHQFVYFDRYQDWPRSDEPLGYYDTITTGMVYGYEPIPNQLPPDKHQHVLGAQGQLWTEYFKTMNDVFYMTYPRACALAEVLWLPNDEKHFDRFLADLPRHRVRFDHMQVPAHPRP